MTHSVAMRDIVPHLADALRVFKSNTPAIRSESNTTPWSDDQDVKHDTLWPRMRKWFIEGGE